MAVLVTTAYLPSLSYLLGSLYSEEVIIEQFETYQKQTCRNHCSIYGPNWKQILSIPVLKVNGNHTLTKDIRVSYSSSWQRIHWRSIETAYNNSPFFLYYKDLFEPFFGKKIESLIDLNTQLLQVIYRILRIDKIIGFTTDFEKNPGDTLDLRGRLASKKPREHLELESYTQVFGSRHGFLPDLSIIDLIFNLGPEAMDYLGNY